MSAFMPLFLNSRDGCLRTNGLAVSLLTLTSRRNGMSAMSDRAKLMNLPFSGKVERAGEPEPAEASSPQPAVQN